MSCKTMGIYSPGIGLDEVIQASEASQHFFFILERDS